MNKPPIRTAITPTGDRVIIRPLTGDETSTGGVIIPDVAKGKPNKGEVLFVGQDESIICLPGETVLFPEHAGTDFDWEGHELKVIRWNDVIAILPTKVPTLDEAIRSSKLKAFHLTIAGEEFAGTERARLILDTGKEKFYLQANVLVPVL